MRYLWLLLPLFLTACGPSQEDIDNTATITCNIMEESKNMDGAMRIREINAARQKIGADPYLGNDSTIKESMDWDLCAELVKGDEIYQTARQTALAAGIERRAANWVKEGLLTQIDAKRWAKGAFLYEDCIGCHGPNGEGGLGPKLGHRYQQSQFEIAARLRAYRAEEEVGPDSRYCWTTAKSLTDDDISNLSIFVELLDGM